MGLLFVCYFGWIDEVFDCCDFYGEFWCCECVFGLCEWEDYLVMFVVWDCLECVVGVYGDGVCVFGVVYWYFLVRCFLWNVSMISLWFLLLIWFMYFLFLSVCRCFLSLFVVRFVFVMRFLWVVVLLFFCVCWMICLFCVLCLVMIFVFLIDWGLELLFKIWLVFFVVIWGSICCLVLYYWVVVLCCFRILDEV